MWLIGKLLSKQMNESDVVYKLLNDLGNVANFLKNHDTWMTWQMYGVLLSYGIAAPFWMLMWSRGHEGTQPKDVEDTSQIKETYKQR